MKTFELTPTNGRKSFYGKAIVETRNNIHYLRSYETIVATYFEDEKEMVSFGYNYDTYKFFFRIFWI